MGMVINGKMKIPELEKKYGKKLIDKILKCGYLDGCTIAIINSEEDIPEEDIIRAIREIKGMELGPHDWD